MTDYVMVHEGLMECFGNFRETWWYHRLMPMRSHGYGEWPMILIILKISSLTINCCFRTWKKHWAFDNEYLDACILMNLLCVPMFRWIFLHSLSAKLRSSKGSPSKVKQLRPASITRPMQSEDAQPFIIRESKPAKTQRRRQGGAGLGSPMIPVVVHS